MPCSSDGYEPNTIQAESRLAAHLLCYVYLWTHKRIEPWIAEASQDTHGNSRRADELISMLCSACKTMSDNDKDRIMYNGRNKDARMLADWWERHQEIDRQREEEELRKRRKAAAVAKISKEDREILGL